MTKVLISFCNLGDGRTTGLHLLDEETLTPVDLGRNEPDVYTGTGLTRDGSRVLHVYVAAETHLAVLDAETLELLADHVLPGLVDVHSLCVHEGAVVVVSSGTDEVIAFGWNGADLGARRVVWAASDTGRDTHHLNSVAVVDGRLLATGFGPKTGERHSSATDGFVHDLGADTRVLGNLWHPHSVTATPRGGLVCESSRSRVVDLSGREVATANGYVRGLAADGTDLLIASSIGRKESRSQPGVSNPADPGAPEGHCTVQRTPEHGWSTTVDVGHFGREIYDLLVL